MIPYALLLILSFAPLAASPADNIRELLANQSAAWNRGDLPGFLAPYWHSEDLTFFSGNTVTRGFTAIHDRYTKRYGESTATMGQLRFDDLDITVLASDAAVARGRYHLQMKDGSAPTGIFTLLLRKIAGKWTIVHDHTSS